VAVYAGRAAAAAAPAVAAAAPLIPPDVVFSAATYIMVPVYAVLILAPHSRMVSGDGLDTQHHHHHHHHTDC
jgi:hypothetical protein